nr:caspase family protein [Spirochaetota bacterium]
MKKTTIYLLFIILTFSVYSQDGSKGLKRIVKDPVIINREKGNNGKRIAFCIGINKYLNKNIDRLKKAENDAKGISEVLKDYGQFDTVVTMTTEFDYDSDLFPTLDNIRRKMRNMEKLEIINPEDLVVFSFSGHGISDDKGDAFLITSNSDPDNWYNTSLPLNEVVEWLKRLKVTKTLLFIDACREKIETGSKGVIKKSIREQKYDNVEVASIFFSTKSGWYSYEDPEGDYGIFSKYIILGLRGGADNDKNGIVNFNELRGYVEENVVDYAFNINYNQKPYTKQIIEQYGDLILSSYEIDIFIDPNNEISTIKTDIIKDEGEKRIILGIPFVKIKSYEGKKSFLISEFEISYSQFAEFIKKTKYKPNGKWDLYYINDSYGNYPVIDVNFEDALAFSNYLSNETGLSISLPTFEQWKRAAGADKTNYTWGNEWDLEATNSNLNNFNGELQINGNKGTLQSITFLKDISIYG